MKSNIFPLLLILIFLGCSDNLPNNPLNHFNSIKYIRANKIVELDKYNILDPKEIEIFNSWYVFRDCNSNDGYLKCLSNDFTKVISGVYSGNGPVDVLGSIGIEVFEDSLYIKDFNHKKLIKADIKDTLYLNTVSNNCPLINYSRIVNNNRFISLDYIGDTTILFLALVDKNNMVYSKLNFPYIKKVSELSSIMQWQLYLNTYIAISPSKDKFAWGVRDFSSFGFGEIANDSLVLVNEFLYSPVELSINSNHASIDNNSITNVEACVGTDKYVIFLYSGYKYNEFNATGRSLLFYSWQGEPIMRIDVDFDLLDINYDKRRNVLYCIARNPEAILVEYDMNGIID